MISCINVCMYCTIMRNKDNESHVETNLGSSLLKNGLDLSKDINMESKRANKKAQKRLKQVQLTNNTEKKQRIIKGSNHDSSLQPVVSVPQKGKENNKSSINNLILTQACKQRLKFCTENLMVQIKEENAFIENVINSLPQHVFFNPDILKEANDIYQTQQNKLRVPKSKRNRKGALISNKQKSDLLKRATNVEIITELAKAPTHLNKKQSTTKKGTTASIIELKNRLNEKIAELQGPKVRRPEQKHERHKNKIKPKKKNIAIKISKTGASSMKIEKTPQLPTTQAVFNKDGNMMFSKFDFSENGIPEERKGEFSGKDYKNLLAKVEKSREKIRKLEETDREKAETVNTNNKWKVALDRVQGVKVKNDPALLKKGIKRRQQKRRSSQKKWNERVNTVKEQQAKKQKKRAENIKARKKEKIDKKIKKALKKGRLIPGF